MRCYGDKPASFMKMNPSGGIPVAIVKVRRGEEDMGSEERGVNRSGEGGNCRREQRRGQERD